MAARMITAIQQHRDSENMTIAISRLNEPIPQMAHATPQNASTGAIFIIE